MRIRHILAVAAVLTLALTGCGTDSTGPRDPIGTVAAPSPIKDPEPNKALDAKTVLAKLVRADLGLTRGAVQDEDTDPNDLLGRPRGYTSRASAELPGGDKASDPYTINRGLVIEVFATVEDADRRAEYIKGLLDAAPILGSEYQYRTDEGRVLVRVSGKVKPSLAEKIAATVAEL
ncbi:hypothetical protein [Verrucosispora sp. WMMD1129]|uniref:hypothetical protein n=1 Tax=Verrucosispora sp. WMMD1129 TaxID=3016093 RepID=UPI00249B9512|nr:hypothetical protein [Verrucosispora sp. WMMD1129]WFE45683.1 hypothetical protein O7624_15650 [Verrucosispora sp. WMMD1129]